jgi:thimet oligopeptidase
MRRPAFLLALVLSASGLGPVWAQQSATTPFTTDITNAASLKRVVDTRIARARTLLDSMLTVTGPRTVANTLAPYDELLDELNTASGQVTVMMDLHPDAGVRQTAEELDRAVSALLDEIPLRTDVHAALKAIDLRRADTATRFYAAAPASTSPKPRAHS